MMGLIRFLQKRPKDSSIRIFRILFALIYIGVLSYNFFFDTPYNNTINDSILWGLIHTSSIEAKLYVKIFIIGLGIFPLCMGVTNMCIMKKKYVRIAQIIYAFVLFFASSFITPQANLDIETLVFVIGFIPLFAGITGKCITSKCLKYGEKIHKIRV